MSAGNNDESWNELEDLRQRVIELEERNAKLVAESETFSWRAFDDAPVMSVMLMDKNGEPVIVDCNESFLQALCCKKEDVVKRPLAEFYTPESRQQLLASGGYEKTKRGGYFEAERQLVGSDGRVIDTILRARPGCAMFIDVTERRHLERAIEQRQRFLAALMSDLPGMVYACRNDRDWTMEFVSEGCRELTGYSPEEVVGNQRISYGKLIHEDDRGFVWEKIQTALREQAPYRLTYRITTAGGRAKWVWEQGRGNDGSEEGVQLLEGFITDVTDRVCAEEAQRKTNRMLRLLSECNQAVVRAEDEANLMNEICRHVVELGGYRMAWVGLAESDAQKTIRAVAQAGYGEDYLAALKVSWGDNERGGGPSGRAIRSQERVVVQNILTDPDYRPWRDEALEHGYGSTIALPLLEEADSLGVLRVYASEPDAFDEKEVSLLTELASDLAYGLVALRTRQEHLEAEEQLRENAARLQTIHEMDHGILRAESIEDIAQTAVEHIGDIVPCIRSEVYLLDVAERRAQLLAAHAADEAGETARLTLSFDEFGDVDSLLKGQTHRVDDIQALSHEPAYVRLLTREEAGSYAKVPLIVQEQLIGAFSLISERPRAFTQQHIALVQEVADQVAVAIQQARLYQQVRLQAQEQERSLKALRQSQERLRTLVETLPEGVCLLDSEGVVLMANGAAKESLPTLTGDTNPERITRLAGQPLKSVLANGGNTANEDVAIEGPPRELYQIAARPVTVENAGDGWLLVIRNVTEQRELEGRVQEQARLASVGQLAAGIAHDFNNMLTIIIGNAEMLDVDPEMPGGLKDGLRSIREQGERASQLILQVLDFSRKTVIQRNPINLGPLLKECTRLLKQTLPEIIETRITVDGNYVVNASATQIQQLITNLAINGRDAMPQGGVLTIHASGLNISGNDKPPLAELRPGSWVVLTVSDTGVGMKAEVMNRIFDPFFTTKPCGKGTGLGVPQVFGIVKQHGGEISVKSKVNAGTTFTVYLPQLEQDALSPRQKTASMSFGHGETILLVEDEREVLKVAKRLLEKLNYRVLSAANGEEALKLFHAHRDEISLVLTDMVMPSMGGKELIEALHEQAPALPFILLSGYASDTACDQEFLDKAANILEKPLALENMAEALSKALKAS